MRKKAPTFFFQENAAFRNHNWYIAVYVALAMFVEQGYGDVRIGYACDEGYTEYALLYRFCCINVSMCAKGDRWIGALPFCSSSFLTARLLNVFHHDVRSRFAETGSFAERGAG